MGNDKRKMGRRVVGVRSCHVIEVNHIAKPAAKEPRNGNQLCDLEELCEQMTAICCVENSIQGG